MVNFNGSERKKNKVQDIMKTMETQMESGWSCGEKNRKLLDNPHYDAQVTRTQWEPRKTKDEMEDHGVMT